MWCTAIIKSMVEESWIARSIPESHPGTTMTPN